jgi:hypothetical protein
MRALQDHVIGANKCRLCVFATKTECFGRRGVVSAFAGYQLQIMVAD